MVACQVRCRYVLKPGPFQSLWLRSQTLCVVAIAWAVGQIRGLASEGARRRYHQANSAAARRSSAGSPP